MLQVVIPQYPGDQSQFHTSKVALSAEEAKILAAEITLFHLSSAGHAAALSEGTDNMPSPSADSCAELCINVYVSALSWQLCHSLHMSLLVLITSKFVVW
jgi:hypothetical protein